MIYFNINYNALKDYIQEQKNQYDLVDILYLLNYGFINQQQYEDLVTIVSKPMYNYNNFMQEDKGYYRQQGPLTNIQVRKDICASAKQNNKYSRLKKVIYSE